MSDQSTIDHEFRITFPTTLAVVRNTDHFRIGVLPQFHNLLREAGLSLHIGTNINEFLDRIDSARFQKNIIFDLANTKYLGLIEILKLLVLGDLCHKISRRKIIIILPKQEDRRNFLETMDFYNCLSGCAKIEMPVQENADIENKRSFGRSSVMNTILPITPIRKTEDVGFAITELIKPKVTSILQKDFGMNEEAIHVLSDTVAGEICGNICEHSRSTGYVAIQIHYYKLRNITVRPDYKPKVELAISDGGIGIYQSLRDKDPTLYRGKEGREIIDMVLNGQIPKVHGEEKYHGGINRVRDRVRDDFSGDISIESCFSAVKRWFRSAEGRQYAIRSDTENIENFFIGTHINIKLPRRWL